MKTRHFDPQSVFKCKRANRAFWNACIFQTVGFIRENARLLSVHGDASIYPAMVRSYRKTLADQLDKRKSRYYFDDSLNYGGRISKTV